ncbi:MAG TPA: protein kinase [Longimicrobiales bacterium]|nr:protein kinase [Longimicrobiales bacterium]
MPAEADLAPPFARPLMTDIPSRLTAALTGRYRIERQLGEGGMATVYLAEDLKHERSVALKVLRPELAAVIGADRFLAEIKTTANLQHPHILPLFDSGEAEGFLYYVMPYIEGETLRQRIDREGQLGVEEAVRIARDVADALDYAHRKGIVHRDIKPANILLQDGRPVVADFGIALALSAAGRGRMTETGLSLGTPHYMSPEQATADRDLTARSDIYSLGSVLYEMLTGTPPHTGASAQQVIMKIVTEEAGPVTRLRKSVPPNVAAAVAQALEKLPADRFQTAGDFRAALHDPGFTGRTILSSPGAARVRTWTPVSIGLAAAVGILTVAVAVLLTRRPPEPERHVTRFVIDLEGDRVSGGGSFFDPGLAISPDGSRIAFISVTGVLPQIMIRDRDRLAPVPVRGTTDVRCCMSFSPDGESLAFLTPLLELAVVNIAGGLSRTLVDSGIQDPSLYGGGVDWGEDGLIYVSMLDGVWRVSPEDGSRERVTTLEDGHRTHGWVDVLPSGRGALLTVIPMASRNLDAYQIAVVDFATSRIKPLFQGVYARYAPTGHVVVAQADGTLLAAPFDADRLEVAGAAAALQETVDVVAYGAARLALAEAGTLVYRGAGVAVDEFVWVDRTGAREGGLLPDMRSTLAGPRISPDGSAFAAVVQSEEGTHIWTRAFGGGEAVRHTFEGELNWRLNWTPSGDAVYFISDRNGGGAVYRKRVDGTGLPEAVAIPEPRAIFEVVPVDDQRLVIRTDNQDPGSGDILLVEMGATTTVTPLVATEASELTPSLSPDRRWLAYVSDEGGSNEVYVRPFPDVDAAVYRVSAAGGTEPVWARSGDELFYRNGNGDVVAATVVSEASFRVTRQQALFSGIDYGANIFSPQFDVSDDGQRFLMVLRGSPGAAGEAVVVMNWTEGLRDGGRGR